MANVESDAKVQNPLSALTRARLVTAAAMAFERLWPKILPLILAALLFAALSWSGLFRALPDAVRYMIGAAFALVALATLIPLWRLRFPGADEITARIEAANRLQHQPIAVQSGKLQADADPVSAALWLEHQRRMAARIGSVSADAPRPAIPRLDPFALRSIPVLLAAVALAFSFSGSGGALTDILHGAPPPEKIPPRVDAWVTPPAYTGRPPVFLTSAANAQTKLFTVPADSEVTLRVTGGAGTEIAKLGAAELKAVPPGDAAPAKDAPAIFKTKLAADAELSLQDSGKPLAGWQFKIIPDQPPKIEFSGDPQRGYSGAQTFAYKATDDYGIASGRALLALEGQGPNAHPLFDAPEFKLSPPGRKSKDGLAKTSKDISEHPWAGAPVRVTLVAADDSGQEGRSKPGVMALAEKVFANPIAKALIEQRRMLALDANAKPRVLDLLDALTLHPDETISNASHFLGIHTAQRRLQLARTDEELRSVVAYLWEIANGIESFGLTDAQRRMREAQEKLSKALEQGASDEEIAKLTEELRKAMKDVMSELAEEARKNPDLAKEMPPGTDMLTQQDIDKMLDKMQDLAKQGARDEAKQLLSQLNDMMNNLQAGKSQKGGEGQSAMGEQMNKLGEMMRRQQQLMDETQRMDQGGEGQPGDQGDPGQDSGNGDGQGQNEQNGPGQKPGGSFGGLQGRQGQLKRDLQSLMDGLQGMGLDPGRALGDAGKSMGQAEGNLGKGDGGEALADQSEALDALRKGAQGLMNQMQQALGQQGGGTRPGFKRGTNPMDPLGRPRATTGPDFGQTTKVPDDIDVQRAREILDSIRKRLGDALSPQIERNYLERLLKFD
jgi:uncharacterized protein (TIGR02302 family)